MKKISIIIPVYNVEPFIRKCLESVINQTYSNFEIICIDDGSTDASGVICDEYASRDHRIKVIHQKNGGISAAINTGLNLISGEYVGFVDPDDWLERDFYESAWLAIEQYQVDFVCMGWYKETSDQSLVVRNKAEIVSREVNRDEILTYTFMRDTYPAFGAYYWNKLFRANLFNSGEHQLRLFEDLQVGADVVMFVEYALRAKSAIYFEKPCYHYFQRATSIMHSKDIERKKGHLLTYSRVIQLLEQHNISSDILIWVKRFYVYHASLLAEMSIANNDQYHLAVMQEEMKRYLTEYYETNQDHPDRIERVHGLLQQQL